MTVERRSFPESAFSLSSSGDYRQHQHPLASFIRVCVSCPLVPAHTQRLQGRAGHTGAGLGSVSTGREEMWGQSKSSWQRRLQAVEMGRKGGNCSWKPCCKEIWAPPGRALQCRCLP